MFMNTVFFFFYVILEYLCLNKHDHYTILVFLINSRIEFTNRDFYSFSKKSSWIELDWTFWLFLVCFCFLNLFIIENHFWKFRKMYFCYFWILLKVFFFMFVEFSKINIYIYKIKHIFYFLSYKKIIWKIKTKDCLAYFLYYFLLSFFF